MKSTVIPYKIYQQLSPEMKKHLEQRGNYIVTDIPTMDGRDTAVVKVPEKKYTIEDHFNRHLKGSLAVWDNQRSDRIEFNPSREEYEYIPEQKVYGGRSKKFTIKHWIEESPYKPSYDDLLENSKATREAIEEKEREYIELEARRAINKRFKGEKERYEYKHPFEEQHIEELTYQEFDNLRFLDKIRGLFGIPLKQKFYNKKGNFKVVDFHDEELGKANNLKDAIFIFKQTYKYCKDEDALPFIIEE